MRPEHTTPDARHRPRARAAGIIAALVLAAALLALFIALALGSGPDSALSAWDRRVSDAFIAWRTAGRSHFFWAITLVGNVPVLAALGFSAVLLLAVWGRRARAVLVAVGLLLGWGVSEAAKAIVGRPRPPASDALITMPSSGSMPSGHTLVTLVFLGLLLYVAFRRHRGRRPGWVWAALVVVTGLAGLIGVSRVYLGVHWLSDVLGGWVLGGAWLAVFLGGIWKYLRQVRPSARLEALCGPHPPARRVVRVGVVAFVVILCVVTYILTARADPLLADL